MSRRKKPVIPDDVLGQVLAGRALRSNSDVDSFLGDMKKVLQEWLVTAELDHHLDGVLWLIARSAGMSKGKGRCWSGGAGCHGVNFSEFVGEDEAFDGAGQLICALKVLPCFRCGPDESEH